MHGVGVQHGRPKLGHVNVQSNVYNPIRRAHAMSRSSTAASQLHGVTARLPHSLHAGHHSHSIATKPHAISMLQLHQYRPLASCSRNGNSTVWRRFSTIVSSLDGSASSSTTGGSMQSTSGVEDPAAATPSTPADAETDIVILASTATPAAGNPASTSATATQAATEQAVASATEGSDGNPEPARQQLQAPASSRGLSFSPPARLKANIDSLTKQLADAVQHPPKLFYGSMTLHQVLASFKYRGVLLFVIGGGVLSWVLSAWVRGSDLHFSDPYRFSVSFPLAPSLEPGVPLKLKGVQIGSVREAKSGLEVVEAVVEVSTRNSKIPRSSRLVYNKAGPLSPMPFIDIQLPKEAVATEEAVAAAAAAGKPLVSMAAAAEAAVATPDDVDACRAEGLLLCAGDHVTGVQGGGMDELTALMLKNMKRSILDESVLPPPMRQGRGVDAA